MFISYHRYSSFFTPVSNLFQFGEKGSGIRAPNAASIQDFYSIKERYKNSGDLFVDTAFPANDQSLFYSQGRRKEIQWVRAKDLADEAAFINEGLYTRILFLILFVCVYVSPSVPGTTFSKWMIWYLKWKSRQWLFLIHFFNIRCISIWCYARRTWRLLVVGCYCKFNIKRKAVPSCRSTRSDFWFWRLCR